jgi:hypothetical protein
MDAEGEEVSNGKTKKMRVERATYRKEVEAEKKKGESVNNEIDNAVLDLPTPLAHDVPKSNMYVFLVLPFFHFHHHHASTF